MGRRECYSGDAAKKQCYKADMYGIVGTKETSLSGLLKM